MSQRLLSADFFSGAGGLTLGLQDAGFECAFAVDTDPHACATFSKHFEVEPFRGDIFDLSADFVYRTAGIAEGSLAVVCGGPPCQGFSVQGRGAPQDLRNDLVVQFARVAAAL